jgi:hypothetical protein
VATPGRLWRWRRLLRIEPVDESLDGPPWDPDATPDPEYRKGRCPRLQRPVQRGAGLPEQNRCLFNAEQGSGGLWGGVVAHGCSPVLCHAVPGRVPWSQHILRINVTSRRVPDRGRLKWPPRASPGDSPESAGERDRRRNTLAGYRRLRFVGEPANRSIPRFFDRASLGCRAHRRPRADRGIFPHADRTCTRVAGDPRAGAHQSDHADTLTPRRRSQPAGDPTCASMPTTGLFSIKDPVDPSKGALKEKMPPSEATSQ